MTRAPRLALLAVDPTWEDPSGDFAPFTYGVRKLEASILSCPDLAHVETKVIDLPHTDPAGFMAEIEAFQPTLVGASLFLWSVGPFMEISRRIKAWDPSVQIIVGGPHARQSIFDLPTYHDYRQVIDAAVTGEGEEILREIVRHHQEDDWTELPGLLVPTQDSWRSTGPLPRPDINAYASPYHLGTAPHKGTGFIETFRGCPIHCCFCQWGEQKSDRVHDVDYLVRHLEGLRDAEVPNVYFLDAAFNLSPRAFRNLMEAEEQVGFLKNSMVHGHLYPTFLKDEHVDLLRSFDKAQVSIGIQSFDVDVLHKLGRPFDIERFERVVSVIRQYFAVDLELMLGLPGDTPESFRETFHRSIEIGDTLRVFRTLVLPDALVERADAMNIKFDPDTFLLESCDGWSAEDLQREYEYVQTVARQHTRVTLAQNWVGFGIRGSAEGRDLGGGSIQTDLEAGVEEFPIELIEELRQRIGGEVDGWKLRVARNQLDGLFFDLDSPTGRIVVEVVRHNPERRYFFDWDGIAYSYLGNNNPDIDGLRQVIDLVHPEALAFLLGTGVVAPADTAPAA